MSICGVDLENSDCQHPCEFRSRGCPERFPFPCKLLSQFGQFFSEIFHLEVFPPGGGIGDRLGLGVFGFGVTRLRGFVGLWTSYLDDHEKAKKDQEHIN